MKPRPGSTLDSEHRAVIWLSPATPSQPAAVVERQTALFISKAVGVPSVAWSPCGPAWLLDVVSRAVLPSGILGQPGCSQQGELLMLELGQVSKTPAYSLVCR